MLVFLAAVSKLHNQIASWDTKFDTGTKTALLQPFSPVVIASDENERIRFEKCFVNLFGDIIILTIWMIIKCM